MLLVFDDSLSDMLHDDAARELLFEAWYLHGAVAKTGIIHNNKAKHESVMSSDFMS
ncbi:MAG: hypothetical protein GY749_31260 [Desulfobacteraceae bacterium]|nr:hypothetical protein [Desulfobacteraceae bacterium]